MHNMVIDMISKFSLQVLASSSRFKFSFQVLASSSRFTLSFYVLNIRSRFTFTLEVCFYVYIFIYIILYILIDVSAFHTSQAIGHMTIQTYQ